MKIKYLAHASFLITSLKGVRIITDPYAVGGPFKYQPIQETADAVTVSHEHGDHNNAKAVAGNPTVLKDSGEAKGIKFIAVPTAHDDQGGSQRGKNMIFCFEVDGVKVCHCGDLGHTLTAEQLKAMGKVDVLMLPVGGFFTIDAKTAGKVGDQVKPAVIIPMHFNTEKADMPISGVEEFTKGKMNVSFINSSEVELDKAKLPQSPQIVVLQHAL
jgi:L-ascorbate metabolism protein UlaG (beta-lactamase superfamily)